MKMVDPKTVVDSVGDGVVSALGLFPNIAQKVAQNAANYATGAQRDLASIKAAMPDDPTILPRVAFGVVGQTVGAGIGMVEAIIAGTNQTLNDIKAQANRVL